MRIYCCSVAFLAVEKTSKNPALRRGVDVKHQKSIGIGPMTRRYGVKRGHVPSGHVLNGHVLNGRVLNGRFLSGRAL